MTQIQSTTPTAQWMEDFKKWSTETTATFESDEGEDFNVNFSSLVFYNELENKVAEIVQTQIDKAREEGRAHAIKDVMDLIPEGDYAMLKNLDSLIQKL